jgi:hypothetical protein
VDSLLERPLAEWLAGLPGGGFASHPTRVPGLRDRSVTCCARSPFEILVTVAASPGSSHPRLLALLWVNALTKVR